MADPVAGIHHVTALSGDPGRTLDFYAGILGLRVVKRTVNFDEPTVHHLYFGDGRGRPGTVVTFFPWPRAPSGRVGTGEAEAVAFAVPRGTSGAWTARLRQHGVEIEGSSRRFGREVVSFEDPDGLSLELVAEEEAGRREPWSGGPVSPDRAIRGLFGVTLLLEDEEPTGEFLREVLGLRRRGRSEGVSRYRAPGRGPGRRVDLRAVGEAREGRGSAGTVHHVAWRAGNRESQHEWRRRLVEEGIAVSRPRDRHYFRSIYFRGPGGVRFEMATESPGFTRDEDVDELGSALRLPPWLEDRRAELESRLPPIESDLER